MKETIYTIPINEAYDVMDGCPICRLENDLEATSVDYIMGAAMMEPDVRMETNKVGFCPTHFKHMLTVKKRLSLALMLESYLNDLCEKCLPEDTSKISKKELDALSSKLKTASDECFICNQLHERMEKYYRNIIYLWRTDAEFRKKTLSQEYFCIHHIAELLAHAQKELDKKSIPAFLSDHMSAARKKAALLNEHVSAFCKSFDHRFANIPLSDDAKYAVEKSIDFLNGNKK